MGWFWIEHIGNVCSARPAEVASFNPESGDSSAWFECIGDKFDVNVRYGVASKL